MEWLSRGVSERRHWLGLHRLRKTTWHHIEVHFPGNTINYRSPQLVTRTTTRSPSRPAKPAPINASIYQRITASSTVILGGKTECVKDETRLSSLMSWDAAMETWHRRSCFAAPGKRQRVPLPTVDLSLKGRNGRDVRPYRRARFRWWLPWRRLVLLFRRYLPQFKQITGTDSPAAEVVWV